MNKQKLIGYAYELRDDNIISKKQFQRIVDKILDKYKYEH